MEVIISSRLSSRLFCVWFLELKYLDSPSQSLPVPDILRAPPGKNSCQNRNQILMTLLEQSWNVILCSHVRPALLAGNYKSLLCHTNTFTSIREMAISISCNDRVRGKR